MPNHVSNRLEFKAFSEDDWRKEDAAFKQLQALMKTDDRPFDFNVLIPYPDTFKVLDDKRRELEKTVGFHEAFKVKDGYNSGGYEWCIANWGTKWNAYDIGITYDAVYFQTAWATPLPIWAEISKRFPDLQVIIEYADEDRGNNCGRMVYLNGEQIEWVDMSMRPDADLFARAIIAEQESADNWAQLQKLKASIEKPATVESQE